nr:MAG TPA: hypothetical protein [Bacteriophage sp.]
MFITHLSPRINYTKINCTHIYIHRLINNARACIYAYIITKDILSIYR